MLSAGFNRVALTRAEVQTFGLYRNIPCLHRNYSSDPKKDWKKAWKNPWNYQWWGHCWRNGWRNNWQSNWKKDVTSRRQYRREHFLKYLLKNKMFHPIESVTDPENQIPTFKGFTSNANTKIDISKMGKLKPVLPNDAYVSCTVFDQSGNNIAISKRYPKMQFLKDHNLHPRDLRKIDTSLVDVAPQIMIRPPNTILVNLSHIKALIKEEQVMIFDTSSPEIATKLGLFIYDLESKLKAPNNMPFEFKVLETILINVMGYLEAELKVHIQNCGAILSELESQVDRKKLQDLLIRSKGVQSYYQKVLLIKQALETLLDNDEDLAAMYLLKPRTAELKGHTEEIENILESYYSHCDEFVQHSGSLVHDIKATEEIVNIILDANRNSLMLFELKVTIYTLGITFATLVPAFYGMNLKNFIEESQYGFGAVVAFSILQGLFLTMLNLKALNKVQRLTRMGGSSRSKKMGETLNMSRRDVKQEWLYVWMKYMKMKRTHYHYPTMKERFAIWRMMNDNRRK